MSDTTQQKDNAKPAAPLLGREHLTEQERIEFLQSARDQEKRYDTYVSNLKNRILVDQYPHEQLPDLHAEEHKFSDPMHPVNIKEAIANSKVHMDQLEEKLNTFNKKYPLDLYPLNPDPSLTPLLDPSIPGPSINAYNNINLIRNELELKKLAVENRMIEHQTKLEAYYEANPHKRPESKVTDSNELTQVAESKTSHQSNNQIKHHKSMETEIASDTPHNQVSENGSVSRVPWHRDSQYYSYKNPITDMHISRIPDISHGKSNEPRPLKPYAGGHGLRRPHAGEINAE